MRASGAGSIPAATYSRSKPRVPRGVTKASVPARDRPLLSCTNLPLHAVTCGSSPSQKPPHTLPPRHHFQPFIRLAVAQFLVYHPVVNSGIKLRGYLVQKREQCPAQHPPILPTGAEERCPSRMRSGLSCSCTRVARGVGKHRKRTKPSPTQPTHRRDPQVPFLQSAEYKRKLIVEKKGN